MRLKAVLCLAMGLLIAGSVFRMNTFNFDEKGNAAMSECSKFRGVDRIVTAYENAESWKIPAVIPLNDIQRSYVSEVFRALTEVIIDASSLPVHEKRILGCGQFYWPKNPDEPVMVSKSYFGGHFRMAGIAARLKRNSESAPWTEASLTVHPRNFPRGVYDMKLPAEVFRDFDLKEIREEDRGNERMKKAIVFYFEHKRIKKFVLRVDAREDVASARDSFPSSFYAILMTRGAH